MGNSASSQGSSTGTHEGDVGSSISEEQHDWPTEQAADTPDVQSLQEMRKPYIPPIISGTDKATNFKFGRYILGVHPNKSPLKFWEKMERGHIQGLPKFFEYRLLSQERVKLRTSTFVCTFLVSIGRKVHYKFLEK